MAGDIISKKTRMEFREHFVGWTCAQISDEFDAADVPCDRDYTPPLNGARRSLVEQYYHAVDFTRWEQARKVLDVYADALEALENSIQTQTVVAYRQDSAKALLKLTKLLERDGLAYARGRITRKGHTLPDVRSAAAALDVPELHRQIERLDSAVNDDPGLAIGTAKELVETTCKTILHARNEPFDDNADIGELVKATRKALELLPDDVPNAAKGADTIRRLLSNLGTIAQGLGELRNLYGTGHGRTGAARGLKPRHARLAVGSAGTLAAFLLETHEERSEKTTSD